MLLSLYCSMLLHHWASSLLAFTHAKNKRNVWKLETLNWWAWLSILFALWASDAAPLFFSLFYVRGIQTQVSGISEEKTWLCCLRSECSLPLPVEKWNGKAGILRAVLLDLLKSTPPTVLFILFSDSLTKAAPGWKLSLEERGSRWPMHQGLRSKGKQVLSKE